MLSAQTLKPGSNTQRSRFAMLDTSFVCLARICHRKAIFARQIPALNLSGWLPAPVRSAQLGRYEYYANARTVGNFAFFLYICYHLRPRS